MSGLHVQPPLGSSSFAPFSEVEKIHPNISEKRPISQNMRQNDPQRAPPGTLKGGQKCLKILKKVTLGVSWETPWPQSGPGGSQGSIFVKSFMSLYRFPNDFVQIFRRFCTDFPVFFNDSGSFSPLCSLYSVPLSLSSALSGPLVYTGIFRKALAHWRFFIWVPFRGRSRGGESERGRKTTSLEERPRSCISILGVFL